MRLSLLLLALCAPLSAAQSTAQLPSNIIIFLLDDVGADSSEQFRNEGRLTPNMDALANAGLSFERAYSHAWCKPSRYSLYLGCREGVALSESCVKNPRRRLPPNLKTFVHTLKDAGYLTGLIGKWHVGPPSAEETPWWFAPREAGFEHWWAGSASSRKQDCNPGKTNSHDDGVFKYTHAYPTVAQRDRLFALMDEAEAQEKPLFAVVAFSDAHKPWKWPPASILPRDYPQPWKDNDRARFRAEVAGIDFVIGEVMARLPDDSLVIVASENGTPKEVIVPATDRGKSSVYETGVRIPLIIHGPGVEPGINRDPVQLYDLGTTILSLVGLDAPGGDGRNILAPAPKQHFVFVQNPAEQSRQRAVIEPRFKLIETSDKLEFYDLKADPVEASPLPLAGPDFTRLQALLKRMPGGPQPAKK